MDQRQNEFDSWIQTEQLESCRDVIVSALGSNLIELKQVTGEDITNAFERAGARRLVLDAVKRLREQPVPPSTPPQSDGARGSAAAAAAATTAPPRTPLQILPPAIDLVTPPYGLNAVHAGDRWSDSTFLKMPGCISIDASITDIAKFDELIHPSTPFSPRPDRFYNDEGDFERIAPQLFNLTQLSAMVDSNAVSMPPADRIVVTSMCSLLNVSPMTKESKEACNDGIFRMRPLIRVFVDSLSPRSDPALPLRLYVYISKDLQNVLADRATKDVLQRLNIPPPRQLGIHQKSRETKTWKLPEVSSAGSGSLLSAAYASMVNHGYTSCNPLPPINGLKPELREFQRQSVSWMCDREGTNLHEFFYSEFKAGPFDMFYLQEFGEFSSEKPPITYGGILAEEMGLGKTVETIALILARRVRTLVIVPDHLKVRPVRTLPPLSL